MLSRSAPSKNGSASLTLKRRASSPSVLSTSKERNMSHKAWTASPSMAATSIRSASTAPLAVYRCTKTAFILNQDGVVSTPPVSSVPGSLIGLPRSSPRKPLNNSSRRNLLRLRVHQKPAKAVNHRRHLLRPGQTHLPGMPPEAPQGVEALPRDARQRLLDRRTDPPVAAVREPADDARRRLRRARLGDVRRLRGGARGVRRREGLGGAPARQVPDHGRDVHPRDAPAVLGPDLDRVGPRHHVFSPVARYVVVDAPRKGREQRALPVKPAPHNEGDALGYPHARHRPPIGQPHLDPEIRRALKGHRTLPQRPVARPALPRQHRPVRHERDEAEGGEETPQVVRILDGLDVEPGPVRIQGLGHQRPPHDLRQLFEQHGAGGPSVHAASPGRKPHRRPRLDETGLDDHRGAGEDLLGGALYLHPPAPARAAVAPHDAPDGPIHLPRQEVLEPEVPRYAGSRIRPSQNEPSTHSGE